jgi:hypothetical protein
MPGQCTKGQQRKTPRKSLIGLIHFPELVRHSLKMNAFVALNPMQALVQGIISLAVEFN